MRRRLSVAAVGVLTFVVNSPRRLAAATAGTLLTGGVAYSLVEGKGPVVGQWWALVTMSTTGYGDQYPTSTEGRGIAAVLIAMSVVLLIPSITAVITARLVQDRNEFSHAEQEEIKGELDDTRADLKAVRVELAAVNGKLDKLLSINGMA